MKIDFTKVLTTFDGQEIKEGDKVFTLGFVAANALLTDEPAQQGQAPVDGMTKAKNGWLAEKIYQSISPLEITAEEIVLVKDKVGKFFPTLIVCQVYKMLENPVVEGVSDVTNS
jgi:hypothetical protein